MSLFAELRRRNVFKVAIAYAVTTWVLLQVTEVLSNILDLPVWAPKLIFLILAVGFLPALIIAWAFELTPEGIKLESEVERSQSMARKTGRKLDYMIMILLGLSLAYFIWESRFERERQAVGIPAATHGGAAEQQADTIRRVVPEGAEANRNSIAVLPFANRSLEAADAYFTDGIHDDLLTQLSKIDALSVISRTSVLEYRDTPKNMRQIARELDVKNIMEGAVQRAGDRVRINVQLIDAETDEHLWAEIYDRELTTENLFDIQTEIARQIAAALEATLTDTELAAVSGAPTENVEAYDLYLLARRDIQLRNRASLTSARSQLERALELDPEFSLAWIALADVHMINYWYFGGDAADRDKARQAIDGARALDDDFPELYVAEGVYWYWGHLDYERALYYLDKAVAQMPGNNEAWMWRGWAFRRAGQQDQALASMERAVRLAPREADQWSEYADTLSMSHRFEDAREAYEKALEVDPQHNASKGAYAVFLARHDGDLDTSLRLTEGLQFTSNFDDFSSFMDVRWQAGRFEEALLATESMDPKLEIQRSAIVLREDWQASFLYLSGRVDEARSTADAAWFRLQGLREQLGDDYRILVSESRMSVFRGAPPEEILSRVEKARSGEPNDAREKLILRYLATQALGMAGLAAETVEVLEPQFSPPSMASPQRVQQDPAFDRVRDHPDFMAMMERHR